MDDLKRKIKGDVIDWEKSTADQVFISKPKKGFVLFPGWDLKIVVTQSGEKIYPVWIAPECSKKGCNTCDSKKEYRIYKKMKNDIVDGKIRVCDRTISMFNDDNKVVNHIPVEKITFARKKRPNGSRRKGKLEKCEKKRLRLMETSERAKYEELECDICMTPFQQKDMLRCNGKTKHFFCNACVDNSLKHVQVKYSPRGLVCLRNDCHACIDWTQAYTFSVTGFQKKHRSMLELNGEQRQKEKSDKLGESAMKMAFDPKILEKTRLHSIFKDFPEVDGIKCCNGKHTFLEWEGCNAITCHACKHRKVYAKVRFQLMETDSTHCSVYDPAWKFLYDLYSDETGYYYTYLDWCQSQDQIKNQLRKQLMEYLHYVMPRLKRRCPQMTATYTSFVSYTKISKDVEAQFCIFCNHKFETKKDRVQHSQHLASCKYLNLLNVETKNSVYTPTEQMPILRQRVRWLRLALRLQQFVDRTTATVYNGGGNAIGTNYSRIVWNQEGKALLKSIKEKKIMKEMDKDWKMLDSFSEEDKRLYALIVECSNMVCEKKTVFFF